MSHVPYLLCVSSPPEPHLKGISTWEKCWRFQRDLCASLTLGRRFLSSGEGEMRRLSGLSFLGAARPSPWPIPGQPSVANLSPHKWRQMGGSSGIERNQPVSSLSNHHLRFLFFIIAGEGSFFFLKCCPYCLKDLTTPLPFFSLAIPGSLHPLL